MNEAVLGQFYTQKSKIISKIIIGKIISILLNPDKIWGEACYV